MGLGATLGLAMVGFAAVGVLGAAAAYGIVPWKRVVDADGAPEGVPVVDLTRIGATLGVLSLVPMAAGGWLTYAGTVAGLGSQATGAEPTLLDRVAIALPGQLVVVGSVAAGILAFFAPVWVSLAVVAWRRVRPVVVGGE